jgi:hypothetical protein
MGDMVVRGRHWHLFETRHSNHNNRNHDNHDDNQQQKWLAGGGAGGVDGGRVGGFGVGGVDSNAAQTQWGAATRGEDGEKDSEGV